MSRYDELKLRAFEANMSLYKQGMVIHTFGNVSASDRRNGVIAIKPSGVDYGKMRPEDMVVLDMNGNVVEGELNPSSDTKTHLVLYNAFEGIGGVAHSHSTYAVAWAQAAIPVPILGTTHADHLHLDIPVTDFMTPEMISGDYEIETGHQIVKRFDKLSFEEVPMVLVAGHGPFTWGGTPEDAVKNNVVLEALCRMAYLTLQINPDAVRLPQALIDKHYRRKHGPDAYYGQSK